MIALSELRSWMQIARINSERGLSRDSRIAEVVLVIALRVEEITGIWPFPECHDLKHPPQSADYYLSFLPNGRIDSQYGYGPEASAYCRKYVALKHDGYWCMDCWRLWPPSQAAGQLSTTPIDASDDLF